MKNISFIIVFAASLFAESPEELFVKARAYTLQGQDSQALIYYEQAYRGDPNSAELQEIIAKMYFRNNNFEASINLFRKAAILFEQRGDWVRAAAIYKDLFSHTQSYYYGCRVAQMIFYEGVAARDTVKTQMANKVWKALIDRALLKGMPSKAEEIIDFQIRAYRNVLNQINKAPHVSRGIVYAFVQSKS